MAIGSVATLGNASIATSASSTNLSIAAAIEAGNVALMGVVCDNTATTDGTSHNEVLSVTDTSASVVWTKLGEQTNGEGSAAAGVTTAVFYRPKQGSTLASSSNVLITFANSVADAVIRAWEFTSDADLELATAMVGNVTDASNGFGSASISGLASQEYLYFRALGKEANVASSSLITPSTGFTDFGAGRSQNAATAVLIRGEFRINTSTGETSDPTFAFAGDTAAVFVALREIVAAGSIAAISSGYHQRGLR